MSGVYLKQGMTVGVRPGGMTLSVGADGKVTIDLTLGVHFDVCPTWLDLATRHLADANQRRIERDSAWASTDEVAKMATLEREFEAAMQAIMAAAIAMDAFYAALRTKIAVPEATLQSWRLKGTARHKQVSEVIRRSFVIAQKALPGLRKNISEIYRLRDLAVHPSGEISEAIPHPELNVGVEWRFAYFRATNAGLVVDAARSIITELVTKGKAKNPDVRQYAETVRARV
jgi:hypothetical protein